MVLLRPKFQGTHSRTILRITIYLYTSECMYVCMVRYNYLSVNGIVSFPCFTSLYKYKEEYKQGEM
jgi:hypothetical protein